MTYGRSRRLTEDAASRHDARCTPNHYLNTVR